MAGRFGRPGTAMSSAGVRATSRALGALAGIALASGVGSAHVEYLEDEEAGVDPWFVVEALSDPFAAALVGGSGLLVLGAALAALRFRPFERDVAVFRSAIREYADLLPWLLRLGFGLPMVGAGFTGYYFNPIATPVLVGDPIARLLQILVGFLLLFGLATRAAALFGLAVYLASVPARPGLLVSFEYVPGFLAIAVLGPGRPSADQVLARMAAAEGTVYGEIDPVQRLAVGTRRYLAPYEAIVPTVVRIGTGLTFVGLGVGEKLLRPEPALATVDRYDLTSVVPLAPERWVLGAGLTEAALGLALLVGAFTRASALVAIGVFTLTLFALPDDPVLAHIGLFSLASALLITGGGPYSLDRYLGATDDPVPTVRGHEPV